MGLGPFHLLLNSPNIFYYMIYTEYIDKNLQEYNKISDIIESTENPEQFEITKNVAEQFAHNCDVRLDILKQYAILKSLSLKFKYWKYYFTYKKSSEIQIKSVIIMCNNWLEQYNDYLQQQKIEEEEHKNFLKDKIDILGFSTLFKKTKKSKNKN